MKVSNLSEGAKSTIAYTISSFFSKGLAFVTVPIFTRIMNTEQIGIVNVYNSWFSLLYVFATLSLTSGGYQVCLKKYSEKRDAYVSSVLSITIVVGIGIGLLLVFVKPITKFIGIDSSLVLLMSFGLIASPAMEFWLAKQRYEYKYKAATFVSVSGALIATLTSIITVINTDQSAYNRLFSNYIIIYGIDFVVLFFLLFKGKSFFVKEYWQYSLKLGLPMVVYSLAAQILNVSDRLMIKQFIGNESVGIYGTLYSISAISIIVWNALNASYVPYLHAHIDNGRSETRRTAVTLLASYAFFSVILTYLSPEIVKVFATREYYEAITIMPPICAGVSLMAISNMYSNILLYYQKPNIIMYSSIIAAAINVVLNYLFIPLYGYKAAAYTTMVAYIVLAAAQVWYVVSSKFGKTKQLKGIYTDRSILIIAILCVSFCLFGLVLYSLPYIRVCFTIIMIVIALLVLKRSKVLTILFGRK